jgi:hypothetical protein
MEPEAASANTLIQIRANAHRAGCILVGSRSPHPGAERRERDNDLRGGDRGQRDNNQNGNAVDCPRERSKAEWSRRADCVRAYVVAPVEEQRNAPKSPIGRKRDDKGRDASASHKQPGYRANAGAGGEGQSDGEAGWRFMKDREPGDKHAGGREHALDPEVDHANEDDQRFPDRSDN